MANEHFKQQKDAMQKEREELAELRTQLKDSLADESRLRHQLDAEKRRSCKFEQNFESDSQGKRLVRFCDFIGLQKKWSYQFSGRGCEIRTCKEEETSSKKLS